MVRLTGGNVDGDERDASAGRARAFLGHWIPAIHAGMTEAQASRPVVPAEAAPDVFQGLPRMRSGERGDSGSMDNTTTVRDAPEAARPCRWVPASKPGRRGVCGAPESKAPAISANSSSVRYNSVSTNAACAAPRAPAVASADRSSGRIVITGASVPAATRGLVPPRAGRDAGPQGQ